MKATKKKQFAATTPANKTDWIIRKSGTAHKDQANYDPEWMTRRNNVDWKTRRPQAP